MNRTLPRSSAPSDARQSPGPLVAVLAANIFPYPWGLMSNYPPIFLSQVRSFRKKIQLTQIRASKTTLRRAISVVEVLPPPGVLNAETIQGAAEEMAAEILAVRRRIDLRSIQELRCFPRPPHIVMKVIKGVCLVLNSVEKRRSPRVVRWADGIHMLSDPHFFAKRLAEVDLAAIPNPARILPLLEAEMHGWTEEQISNVSTACAALRYWLDRVCGILRIQLLETDSRGMLLIQREVLEDYIADMQQEATRISFAWSSSSCLEDPGFWDAVQWNPGLEVKILGILTVLIPRCLLNFV